MIPRNIENMEMTRECISFTFDPRDILLALKIGFSILRAELACAILERISGFQPSSETTAPRCLLRHIDLPFYLHLPLDAIGTVRHQFDLLNTDLHFIPSAGFVSPFN